MSDERTNALNDVLGKKWPDAERIFNEKYPQFTIRSNWPCKVIFGRENINRNRLNIGVNSNNIVFQICGYQIVADGQFYGVKSDWY